VTTIVFCIIWLAMMMRAFRGDRQARAIVGGSAILAAVLAVTAKVVVWAGWGLATHIL
jgi:uncharacterized membrane protein